MNKFDQLVEDLKDGSLSLNQIQIAIRTWIRQKDNFPEEIKDLLAGKPGDGGLIGDCFQLMRQVMGSVELAYRRGKHRGE